jgi:transcriptional regulator with XRE-family HTH domain
MSDVLARNIQQIIAARGTTPAAVNRKAGLSQTAVYEIISGRIKSPTLGTIEKIAAALETTVIDLLSENRQVEARHRILEAFDRLPPEDQERLLQTAQAWAAPRHPARD